MTNYSVTSTKFYNELRNGPLFSLNLLEFANNLTGNVGELVQVVQEFEITTEIFAVDFGDINYTTLGSQGAFIFSGSWFTEGLSVGATVDISWNNGVNVATETVLTVTGSSSTELRTTNTNLLLEGLADGPRTDFIIRVSSVSDRLQYKYTLNSLLATQNVYESPFDTNQQAYFNPITGALTPLDPVGNFSSWDLGTVEAKTVGTINTYTHQYEVVHTFRIPYFIDGQLGNIQGVPPLPPTNLTGTNSLKYGFGIFLAETNNDFNKVFEDAGNTGTVKYFNEAINGSSNNYSIQNLVYTNAHATPTLEGTDVNSVVLEIKKTSNFLAGQEVILNHSKLPTQVEYQNKTSTYDEVWLFESLTQLEGDPATNGTIITNLTVTLNADPTILDVTFDIQYTAAQQLLIEDDKNFVLSVIVGDETLGVYNIDKVNQIIDSQLWSFDNDVAGLVTDNDIRFYPSGTQIGTLLGEPTNFTGWDGDFVGCAFEFKTKAEDGAVITNFRFRVIADNGTDWFTLTSQLIGMTRLATTDPAVTTYPYQLLNIDIQNNYNITPEESFNRLILNTVTPVFGTSFQDWTGELAFKVTWRDWIQNLAVPNVFYDPTKPNNNLNIKTSNYSGLEGYDIYGVLDVTIANNVGADTIYRIKSDISDILDFDDDGGLGFAAATFFYDVNDDITDNIYINQNVRIEIEFTHALVTLPKAYGEIVIEADGTSLQEWRLSTNKDWTNPLNPLQPTDTLMTGNTQLVETIDGVNKYTLICETNRSNLIKGVVYNVYGILGKI